MGSLEFDLAVMTTAHRDAVASLVASVKATAKTQRDLMRARAQLADIEDLCDEVANPYSQDEVLAAIRNILETK